MTHICCWLLLQNQTQVFNNLFFSKKIRQQFSVTQCGKVWNSLLTFHEINSVNSNFFTYPKFLKISCYKVRLFNKIVKKKKKKKKKKLIWKIFRKDSLQEPSNECVDDLMMKKFSWKYNSLVKKLFWRNFCKKSWGKILRFPHCG